MVDSVKQTAGQKLNYDVHPSLLEDRDLTFLLNGDVSDNEGNNWFVVNQLGNELCYEFPEDYEFKGSVKLGRYEHFLAFKTADSYELGILNSLECSYYMWANDPCLNLEYFIRGVYKYNNKNNDRRVYIVDGENPNRYFDIDKEYPKKYEGSKCENCEIEYLSDFDCEAIKINKSYIKPCINLTKTEEGKLLSGVYQVGIAYAIDNVVLTDFTFSRAIKVFSESANIGLSVEIGCQDVPFNQFALVLVSNTRENSLVTYNFGFFPTSNTKFTIDSIDNTTIFSTQQALQKRVVFDSSKHIVTNGEILMLGGHANQERLNYQPQVLEIETEWVEVTIDKELAPFYPSLMRDEVYSFSLEWFGSKGNSRGIFPIVGRQSTSGDVVEYTGDDYATNDIYELEDCVPATLKRWQIENTATLEIDNEQSCQDCSGTVINKSGKMGYWESAEFTYPNDPDVWGDLACQPIRHHRMPSHDLTHIHNNFTEAQTASGECEEICFTIAIQGEFETTYEEYCQDYCSSGETYIEEDSCVNILAVRFKNIPYPLLPNNSPDPDISGYRILVGDRKGNKSILHKGLIFNLGQDTSTPETTIYYPNYPYNDLHPDVFLSTQQTLNNSNGDLGADADWTPPQLYSRKDFTYHSPDIHFREIQREFGTELKVYGEEVGWIEGKFDNVYLHPKTRLGVEFLPGDDYALLRTYNNHAGQMNSVCNYSKFVPWTLDLASRFKINTSQYLLPINQITSNNKKINNYLRESSYYLEIDRVLSDPTNLDTSRVLASEVSLDGYSYSLPRYNYFNTVNRYAGDDLNIQGSSYYTAVKVKQPNQYGSIDSISYRPVGCFQQVSSGDVTSDSDVIFAGDVFISKHTLLRKMPLFTEWLEDVPIDYVEYNYREVRNAWYPRFWIDMAPLDNDGFQYNLDNALLTYEDGAGENAKGLFYVFVTGVLNFWCESEFIGDYRERDFTPNGSFYPKIDYRDIAKTDKIRYDNKFLYNFSLLSNEIERVYGNSDPTDSDNDFTVSYSLKDDPQSTDDKWLQFLPLNYTVLPRIFGEFTGMHYTDDYSIFFAFENNILYSQLNYTLNTNEGNSLLLTQGDIFTNRLRRLSNEQTGYVGCVDPLSFCNTRYGTFFFDRYRRKLFQWNGSLKDVTGNMQSWLQHFTTNESVGYEDNTIVIIFDNYTENLYIRGASDRDVWCLSYKPKLESWISFHSFTPRFFLVDSNTYLSANETGIWKHNKEFLYQSYYGEQVPFDVGLVINNKYKNQEFQNVEVFAEFYTQSVYGSPIYKTDKFFDKIFAYNNNGSTGLLDTYLKNLNNPAHSLIQNSESNPVVAEVTRVQDSVFRINKFENLRTNHNSTPLLLLSDNGMDYTPQSTLNTIPPHQRSDIKGKWIKFHLRSEDNTDHKILLQLIVPNQDQINV